MNKNKNYIIYFGIIVFLLFGYFITDKILFNGLKPYALNENGIQANYFVKENTKNATAVILIGGGQWGDYWAQQLANKGMVGLSLPYIGNEDLPKILEEIELEYFEKAIDWLIKQPQVDKNNIVVMGASRNAELALIIASTFNTSISGVIAYAPSSVSWSNTVLPYSSNEMKSSWKYKGTDVPYIPMEKIEGNQFNKIELLPYWKNGLTKIDSINNAAIKVENINGPILLFSGNDDKVWPSSIMADMIEQRLKDHHFKHSIQNIKYENAGHLISNNPDYKSNSKNGMININEKTYQYEYGGNDEGDFKAKQDAKIKVIDFLEKL